MSVPTPLEGDLQAAGARFAIVATRFNDFIVARLVTGALDALTRHGAAPTDIKLVRVPGAYELPLAVRAVARRGTWDAIIALGCVIRGATPHFEYVAGACAEGLARACVELELPVALGVLTTETLEQAIERAGSKAGNRGAEAALSAIEMVSLLRKLEAG